MSPTCLPLWVLWGPRDFTCVSHLSPTFGCDSGSGSHDFTLVSHSDLTLVSHLFSRLTQNMLLLDLCQLPCLAAALDSFTSVWGQRWYNFVSRCGTVPVSCLQMQPSWDVVGSDRSDCSAVLILLTECRWRSA